MNDQTNTNTASATKKPKKAAAQTNLNALEQTGLSACKRHGLAKAFVTADGIAFGLETDARNHAANLSNKQITTVNHP